jgi:hypothetical protein
LRATVRAGFGEENAVPACAAGGDVVDIKDEVREALVKDAGLNGEGDLGSDKRGLGGTGGAERERGQPEGHQKGESRTEHGEKTHGNENALATDAESSEGDDFAVHGHAAEAEKNANEDAHGDSKDEDAGDDAEEEGGDLRVGAGMADEDFHEADELGDEENEGENEQAEESVAGDFAGDIAVEDAHGAKGECNMVASVGDCGGETDIRYQQPAPKNKKVKE